jgi:menaquinone-specific isochorismate synthase
LCWLRGGDGLVAWGEAARIQVKGPERFEAAAAWWAEVISAAEVDDLVGVPGSGPVAFGSFTFDDGPGDSVMIVPRVVVGRRAGAAWVTTVGLDPTDVLDSVPEPVTPIGEVRYSDGSLSLHEWEAAVEAVVARIRSGELDKVVLARDVIATTDDPVDPRALLNRLAQRYPGCWTFAVDGLVGATPELLLRRTGDHVESRVLAGTIDRGADAVADAEHAAELLASAKDRSEHELAVRSVAEALAAYCSDLVVPRRPEIVRLANVQHLATDVTGRLGNGESALDLAAALHPTAAVCGTPTQAARSMIREFEGMDRGRYAGPVGWVDARGDGAFGLALRCAEVDDDHLRLFAGCGLVAGSEPAAELAESQAKLLAMRDALEGH